MHKRLLFIYNPHTGGGRLKQNLMSILCHLSAAGYELTVCPTAAGGDARRFAQEKGAGYDLVVCCGGDGTLNETVHGLLQLHNPPELGYIPGGTTNDFATSLHLPKTNMLAAAERAVHPRRVFACDVGKFNDRVFNYVAAFGKFTDVSYKTPQKFKNLMGYAAYIMEGIQRLPENAACEIEMQTPEGAFSGEVLLGMVSNSTSVAGYTFFDQKDVKMDDGLFEVLLVRQPHNLSDLRDISSALLTRNQQSHNVIATRASEIVIRSSHPISWTLDGEFGGELEEANIRVLNKALHIHI